MKKMRSLSLQYGWINLKIVNTFRSDEEVPTIPFKQITYIWFERNKTDQN